jgi:signal transduction histidine kinase/ligand-binding sensor domain-containing protein
LFRDPLPLGFRHADRACVWLRRAVLFLAIAAVAMRAQSNSPASAAPASPQGQFIFDLFGTEIGLPQTNVTAARQTRDGYLWVGTEAGLGRFDGVRFVAFKRSNTPAFVNHSVRRLYEAADGALWIGTESGVVRYRGGVFEHVGLAGMIVTAIAQDGRGCMWFGTDGHGLHTWKDGRFHSYEDDSAMLGRTVRSVFVDSSDRVWIGFARVPGAVIFENGRFQFRDIGGVLSREVNAIAEWPRGTLWFGCGRGLYRLENGQLDRADSESNLPNPQVTDLQPALGDGLWIVAGTVLRVTRAKPFAYTPMARLPTTAPRTVTEDREGNVWICAQFDGLLRARWMFYRTISTEDGLPGNVIKGVSEDTNGSRWLAIQGQGLTRVAPDGAVSVLGREAGLPSHDPLSVYAATDGTVWSSYSVGLSALRDGRAETFPDYRSVRVMHEDRRGNMWFGSDDALLMRSPDGRFERIAVADGRPTMVNGITEGSDGSIYVATAPGGLSRIQDGRITTYPETNEFLNTGVRALYVDRQERVWIGIKGRGLGVWADGRWYNPNTLADAVTDHVSAIVEDRHGQLWLGTASGIMWAAKDELLAAARGERAPPRLRLAGMDDGFRVTPASSHSQPTVWPGRNNALLFATRRGLLEINPDYVPPNGIAPPVHIERVLVDGRAVQGTERVELAPGVRQLVIEYTALSFVEPRRVSFRYRLEGYDADWVEVGARRFASYANLPAGNYVFHVVACNSDGQWNETGDGVAIRQVPYFYETWWFAAIAAGVVLAIGFGLFRWSRRRLELELERMQQKHALERERHRIAKNLHDDLGANLTEIGLFAEAARRRTAVPEAIDDMVELSQRVRGLVGSLDAIVWAANPANDSLDRVATYICEYFQSLFVRSSIRCRVDVAGDMPAYPLTPEERTNLFLTAKEAMNNVLKHSGATQAWLRMKMDDERFRLVIEDNGRGFDPAAPENTRRNGLQNMRSRIEELCGTFTIETSPGVRTCVVISISFAGKKVLADGVESGRLKENPASSEPSPRNHADQRRHR